MKIIVDGVMTEYQSIGHGSETILFLHGWGSSFSSFQPLIKDLSSHYKVIGVNFPGFAGTSKPPKAWDVGDYVTWTRKFLDKLKVKQPHAIVGHSFGGRIMLKGCASGQLVAEKLIFIDAAGVKPTKSSAQAFRSTILKLSKPILNLEFMGGARRKLVGRFGSDDYKAADGVMRETFVKVIDEDLSDLMPSIKSPSLLIWGENDRDTPLSDLAVFEQIPKHESHVIKNAGHYSFLDQPEQVLKLIKDFLK